MGIVVRKERPELEEQKDSLVINIASGKRKLQELEDEILRWATHKDTHVCVCVYTRTHTLNASIKTSPHIS